MSQDKAKMYSSNGQRNGMRPTRLYKAKGRSRITNGGQLLRNIDSRTFWVRRFRDLNALHLSDLGGSDQVSAAEQSIVRRAACLEVEVERLEMLFAQAGEATPNQLELYGRTANTLRRLLESVGLGRRAKPVPDLQSYLRTREAGVSRP